MEVITQPQLVLVISSALGCPPRKPVAEAEQGEVLAGVRAEWRVAPPVAPLAVLYDALRLPAARPGTTTGIAEACITDDLAMYMLLLIHRFGAA